MTVKITLPGGITIDTDTLTEAVAVARALAPAALAAGTGVDLEHEPEKPRRTRLLVTNGDLKVLETWGLLTEEDRQAFPTDAWPELARELRRTVVGAQTLVRRYVHGAYTSSGSDPTALATVHPDKDPTRPKAE